MSKPKIVRNFSDEQILDVFRSALEIVEQLDPPEDLRLPTFNGVASMLANFHQEMPDVQVPHQAMHIPRSK